MNYNRYAYCFNNPFRYTDPSGEIVWFIPVIIGAVIGAYSGYQVGLANGATGWGMAGYIAGGAAIGALSGLAGGVAAGFVSTAIGGAGGAILGAAVGGGVTGALNGGSFAAMGGQNLKNIGSAMANGFASGFVAGAVGGALASIAPAFTQSNLAIRYATKAIWAGGTGAAAGVAATFTSDLVDDWQINTPGQNYLNSMLLGGGLGAGISLGYSAYDYATWDRFSSSDKIEILKKEFGTDKIRLNNNMSKSSRVDQTHDHDTGKILSYNDYIEMRSDALATHNLATSLAEHEFVHLSYLNAGRIVDFYDNANEFRAYSKQLHGNKLLPGNVVDGLF